jgi:hypothetical protein
MTAGLLDTSVVVGWDDLSVQRALLPPRNEEVRPR